MAKKKIKWSDTEDIAFELIDKYPQIDPTKLSLQDIQRRVTGLTSFSGPAKVDSEVLESIQQIWYEERTDMEDELGPLPEFDEDSNLDEDDYRDDRMVDDSGDDLDDDDGDDDEDEDGLGEGFHEEEFDDR